MGDKIEIGDTVVVCFACEESITGEVLYRPQEAGDCWHIKNQHGLFYVQTFQHLYKEAPRGK